MKRFIGMTVFSILTEVFEIFINNSFCCSAKGSLHESLLLHFKIKMWCSHHVRPALQSPLVRSTLQVYPAGRIYVQHGPEGQVLCTAQTCSYSS